MAEEEAGPEARFASDSLVTGFALGGGSRDKADVLLTKQSALIDLQIENLRKLDEFETSHLRWRRFNDQMRGALQIMVVAVGALIVVAIAAAMWNASRARGLVVDSFSVPPQLAQAGTGGDLVATDLTNRIAAIRTFTVAHSLSNSDSVSKNGQTDIHVEIPETGVSLGEVWRYLREWLGNEQHVSGSLRQLPNGTLSLRADLDGQTVIVDGPATDLDKLEQQAAEQIFAVFDPINDVLFLWNKGRSKEALDQAATNAHTAVGRMAQADAYSLWANATRSIVGDVALSNARARISLSLNPHLAAAWNELAAGDSVLGHDEGAWNADEEALKQPESAQPEPLQGQGFVLVRAFAEERVAALSGDFNAAARAACLGSCTPSDPGDGAVYAARNHDVPSARALLDEAGASALGQSYVFYDARYYIALEEQDWRRAADLARHRDAQFGIDVLAVPAIVAAERETHGQPMLAVALARSGDIAGAEAAIATTPADCYVCQRTRGQIAALQGNWDGAARLYADATTLAPSLPFAYAEWGAVLLRKGDSDAAITKFEIANQKGPHFADPLELWGEALMAKNRSDLALAKFSEANQYAPHWGRLHLKWGEALRYAGQPDEANRQFAVAAGLFLTPAEHVALGKDTALHG